MPRTINAPVHPGDILARKYRVERVLGAGTMGVVVEATHVELGQRVAVKFMRAESGAHAEQRERFLREARAVVRLRSQHVARVLDVGTLENEAPYIVMELLEGQDLSALLKSRGPLPFDEAVAYVLQASESVGEAHAAGVVHRDLKPANLFLTEDVSGSPCIKVLDFGISKLSGVDLTLTGEAEMLGSPLYMSPEQMRCSKEVDARSDVWALGVVLYQLVAGQTPFHAETMAYLCSRVCMGDPTPLGDHRKEAPPGFEAAVMRCFARDREQRYPDVAALAEALAPYAPEHARAYPRRVARVLGRRTEPLVSMPESSPGIPITQTAAHPSGTQAAQTVELPTLPLPPPSSVARPASITPSPSGVRPAFSSAPGLGADTAITLASSQKGAGPSTGFAGRRPVAAVVGVAALGAVGLAVFGVRASLRSSPAASAALAAPVSASSAMLAAAHEHEPLPAPAVPAAHEDSLAAAPEPGPARPESARALESPSASPLGKAPTTASSAHAGAPAASAKAVAARPPAAPPPPPPRRRDGIL